MSEWTDELKQEVIEAYESKNPTPENTVEILNELAEEYEKTANGVRMILTKAGVYVKKAPAASSKSGDGDKKPRVSKADAIQSLTNAIEAAGLEVDEDIVGRLTGKAATYFASVVQKLNDED